MKLNKAFLFGPGGVLVLLQAVHANLAPDRFAAIASANVYRLKPPTREIVEVTQEVERPRVSLQGITTILGRPQALLEIQPPPKAAPVFQSVRILTQSETQQEVVVLEINVETGTVRLNNRGMEQTLILKH